MGSRGESGIASRASSALLLALALAAGACASDAGEQRAGPASSAAETTPAADAPAPAPAPNPSGSVRCGDVISAAELKALGIAAESFDADATGDRSTGARCLAGDIGFNLFPGSAYGSMVRGLEAQAERAGIERIEGPSAGRASQWTRMSSVRGLMFQSEDERYAANLSGTDAAKLEQLARQLLANMQQR